jgi:hypothetical protein
MSKIVTTELGRFRGVTDGKRNWWLWECPNCKTWGNLSPDQMEGRVSVLHSCGYHHIHEYAKELVATIQARMLMGEYPFEEEMEEA